MGLFANAAAAVRSRLPASTRGTDIVPASGGPIREIVYLPQSNAYRRGNNEALDADPTRIVSIMSEAETGRIGRLIDLYKSSRILDSRLDAVCASRILAIQSRPLTFKPPPGFETDVEAKKIAQHVTRLWNSTPGTVPTLGDLGHGVLEHVAISELHWVTDRSTGWWKPVPQFVHPNRLAWDAGMRLCRADDRKPLSDWPDKFIIHTPRGGRSDYPWRRGAMRARVIPSTLKRFTARAWLSLLERWGQPQVAAFVDANDPTLNASVIEALRDLGIDWRAAFPKGVDLKEIPVTVGDSLHKNFIEWANLEDAIAILGQNLSTEVQGGSFAAAAAHNRVRYDILAADCFELAETLTDQWVEPVVRYNWPGAPVPYAEFVLAPRRELTAQEWQAGLYTADEIRQSQGHDPEPDGKGARYFVAGAPALATGNTPAANTIDPAKPSDTGEPGASGPTAKPETTSEPDAAAVEDAAASGDVAGLGLNGAQIKELKQMVIDVSQGVLPRESALGLIAIAFPMVTAEQAAKVLPPPGFTPAAPVEGA